MQESTCMDISLSGAYKLFKTMFVYIGNLCQGLVQDFNLKRIWSF